MSEFLAEARILVRPDTTRFRAELIAALSAATRGVTAPVPVIPVATGAGLANVAAQGQAAAAGISAVTQAQVQGARATQEATRANIEHSKSLNQVRTATLAQAASMTGLRGAVLTAGSAFLGATIAIQAFGRAVGLAASLEEELNVFRVTAQATAAEMEAVADAANRLGRDVRLPGISAIDAAQAMAQLARAGLSVQDSIAGTPGVLQLATAAQIDNATATELAAAALNAFGLNGAEAIRVADVLANSANEAQGSITDMALALRQSSAVARQVGLSLEETVSLLTILARAGITSSDAGTSLRVALTRLIAPTKDAQKALARFNIDLRDADQTLRSDVFVQIGEALESIEDPAERAAINFRIFGQDAQRVAAILGREGQQALTDTEIALGRTGAAAELAAARAEGFSGAASGLSSNLETLGTTLGQAVLPFLESLTRGLSAAVGGLNQVAGAITDIGGGGFEEANASLAEMVGRIEQIQDLNATFVAPEVDDLAKRVEALSDEFARLGQSDRVVQAFRQASAEIDAALQDGVITPLERAQLETSELGALFLRVAPSNVLGGLGADIRSSLEDATATARVGVEDLGAEIRSGIEDASREAALAAREGGEEIGDGFVAGLQAAASRITNQIKGIGEQILRAQVSDDQGAELSLLRQQQERLRNLLRIQEDIVASGGTGAATARRRIREEILPQLASIGDEIDSILQEQVRESERLADEAEDSRNERDRNILRALGLEEARLEANVLRARADEALKNDIAAQVALRNFFIDAIKEVRKTVQDAERAAQETAELTARLIRAQQEISRLKREQAEQIRRDAEEARQRRVRGLELDLEFAEITGNEAAQERALRAIIANLEKRIKQLTGVSNKEKELRNELARRRKQLQELQKEGKETDKSAQQFFFEQLQAQQGFAANLLGNIIPRDMTSGLVGIPSPPSPTIGTTGVGAGVAAAAALQAGKESGGPTAGQANTTNVILERILRAIIDLSRNADTPEAVQNKRAGSALMDGIGGGSGSSSVM